MSLRNFQIRDPIHGAIFISKEERQVIDSRAFQRLRNIKQMGFLDYAFPGATHTRYSHSLGAMYVASRIFKRVVQKEELSPYNYNLFFQAIRMAALLHDVGHPPLSHTTEMLMPKKNELFPNSKDETKATHEDYTLKLILDSELSNILNDTFRSIGLKPRIVASLINKEFDNGFFIINNLDYGPLLRQIISSEIDCDRMDYLLRDSFFSGVNYGKFDSSWLIDNLISIEENKKKYLGFKARALFAFEDFLLSRYHMFASVCFHHTPVIMEKMLERFFKECKKSFILPCEINEYISLDDIDLFYMLRKSNNEWAQRIIRRNPYVMLGEWYKNPQAGSYLGADFLGSAARLRDAGLDVIVSQSKSVISNYFNKSNTPIFVLDSAGFHMPLEEFTELYVRYQTPAELARIYIDEKDKEKAIELIS